MLTIRKSFESFNRLKLSTFCTVKQNTNEKVDTIFSLIALSFACAHSDDDGWLLWNFLLYKRWWMNILHFCQSSTSCWIAKADPKPSSSDTLYSFEIVYDERPSSNYACDFDFMFKDWNHSNDFFFASRRKMIESRRQKKTNFSHLSVGCFRTWSIWDSEKKVLPLNPMCSTFFSILLWLDCPGDAVYVVAKYNVF